MDLKSIENSGEMAKAEVPESRYVRYVTSFLISATATEKCVLVCDDMSC